MRTRSIAPRAALLLVLFAVPLAAQDRPAGEGDRELTYWRHRSWQIAPPVIHNEVGEVKELVLWLDRGGEGRNWEAVRRVGKAAIGQPIAHTFREEDQGRWGYLVQALEEDLAGSVKKSVEDPSRANTPPPAVVILDWEAPAGVILRPNVRSIDEPGKIVIEWSAADHNPLQRPTALSASIDGGHSWQTVATGQPGSGSFIWDVTTLTKTPAVFDLLLRVEIRDRAGNIWTGSHGPIRIGHEPAPVDETKQEREAEFAVAFTSQMQARLGHRDFDVFYRVTNNTGRRVAFVELYYTLDPTFQRWYLYGRDEEQAGLEQADKNAVHHMRVVIPQEHLREFAPRAGARAGGTSDGPGGGAAPRTLGLAIVGVLETGRASAPKPKLFASQGGFEPAMVLTLDDQAPWVSLRFPRGGERFLPGQKLYLQWWAADANLSTQPVRVQMRVARHAADASHAAVDSAGLPPEDGSEWKDLAVGLGPEGTYVHALDHAELSDVQIRAVCTDEMGNVSVDASDWFTVGDRVLGRLDVQDRRAEYENAKEYARRHYQTGTFHLGRGNLERAEAEFRTALSLWSDYADALNNLGVTLYRKRRYADALDAFRRAARVDHENARFHYNTGMAHEALGDPRQAATHYQTALALRPQDQYVAKHLIELALDQADYRSARALLVQLWPDREGGTPRTPEEAWARRQWAELFRDE